MKYYIIAGEASGDLHAANLIKALKTYDSNMDIRAWGGDLMKQQGAHIVKDYHELAFMGFTEVLMNLKTILNNLSFCKKDIQSFKPDVLILVDYPGFNLRIAEFAFKNNIKVFYYISPQIWAWKQGRVHKIKRFVNEMFVILPFEKEFFRRFGMDVHFTGHPLLDAVEGFAADPHFYKKNKLEEKPILALLPGSRKQEINHMLPMMLEASSKFPEFQVVIAGAPGTHPELYAHHLKNSHARLISGQTYSLLAHSRAAAVTSGTATLETALFGVPQVVCYKGGNISYQLAKRLVKVKYISLVNLILDRPVVKELIQGDMNASLLEKELKNILYDGAPRKKMLDELEGLLGMLGGAGASKRTASKMWELLKHTESA